MNFVISNNLEIKNQGVTDFCLACAASSHAEQIIGEPCEEAFTFAYAKKVSGEPLLKAGVSPRNLLRAAIKYGFLPKRLAPYSLDNRDRNFLADWRNWEPYLDKAIKPFNSSFRVRGFDRMVQVMREQKTPILAGLYWQAHWGKSPIIDSFGEFNKLAPHEVLFKGLQDGRIVIQNSRGKEKGDNGLWYLDRQAFAAVDHTYALSPIKTNWFVNLIKNL
jgi:hypothetical protein